MNPMFSDARLIDLNGDGRIVLSEVTCKRLAIPKGTILLSDGMEGDRYCYQVEGQPRRARIALPVVQAAIALTRHASPTFMTKAGRYAERAANGLHAVYKARHT